jgi:hypothetical protein
MIFSLNTYVNPCPEVPTTIKTAPQNTFFPMDFESNAVRLNPNTTHNTPIHCILDNERSSSSFEYKAAHIVTDEYTMENIVGPARLFPAYTIDWANMSKKAMQDALYRRGRDGQ